MKSYFGLTVDNSRTSNQSTDKKEESADDDGEAQLLPTKCLCNAGFSVGIKSNFLI